MNASTITIHWHDDNMPVYSTTFQPNPNSEGLAVPSKRLVTGGGDNNIRIWKVHDNHIEYVSTLRKHTQAVNVVRFNSDGSTLASSGDDGTIILWKLSDTIHKDFDYADDDIKESWTSHMVIRSSTAEIIDLTWSPDSKYIAVGSMDNMTRIHDVSNGNIVAQLHNHNHYVQGVTWDPLNEYILSQSADKSVNVYKLKYTPELNARHVYKVTRVEVASGKLSQLPKCDVKPQTLYYPETLQSFFRRLSFSPDGNIAVTPLGVYNQGDDDDKAMNSVYIYSRRNLNKPIVHLPGFKKPATIISFSPVRYVNSVTTPVFNLPYKMIFTVATQDSVIVYDTANLQPLGVVSSLHYSVITDVTWDINGQQVVVSSTDGFCSIIKFDDGVFGDVYEGASVPITETQPIPSPQKSQDDAIMVMEPPVVNTIDHLLKKKTKKDKKRITPIVIN